MKSTPQLFEEYKDLDDKFPQMEIRPIIEEALKASPRYALHSISEYENDVVFRFHQSFAVYYGSYDLLKKHSVCIQVPGNEDYTFSVSIKKQESWKTS